MSRKGKKEKRKRRKRKQKKAERQALELMGGCIALLIALLIVVPFFIWLVERATSIWYVPGFFTYLRDIYF